MIHTLHKILFPTPIAPYPHRSGIVRRGPEFPKTGSVTLQGAEYGFNLGNLTVNTIYLTPFIPLILEGNVVEFYETS
jgi:hypothetical protein